MRKIPLNHKKFAIVDDEDFEKVAEFKWMHQKTGKWEYAVRRLSLPDRVQVVWGMHHLIKNARYGYTVTHLNGNGLDNRKENLTLKKKDYPKMYKVA